jgi:hypothetical protein
LEAVGEGNFVFRGDSRPPEVIFEQGMAARGDGTDLLAHALDNTSPPSSYIGTSTDYEVAAGFNDQVYVVRPVDGIDVNATLGSMSPFPEESEIAIPWYISGSDIRAVTILPRGVSMLNPFWKP